MAQLYCQEGLEIRKIKFSGNNILPAGELKEIVNSQKSTKENKNYFIEDILDEDLARIVTYYQKEGHLKAKAHIDSLVVRKEKVLINIVIEEGPPVKIEEVSFRINDTETLSDYFSFFKERKIRRNIFTREKKVFADRKVEEDDIYLAKQFEQIGFAYVSVKPEISVDEKNDKASIVWKIDTKHICYFGDVNYLGDTKVKQKILDKQIDFDKGDVYNAKKIERTQDNLYNIGVYRIASTKSMFNEESGSDTINTLVNLKESPRLTSKWGAGYGKETKVRVFGQLSYLHFLGGARRAELLGRHSAIEPYNFSFRLIQPSFFSPKSHLLFSPYISKHNEPGYTLEVKGARAIILQKLTKRSNMSLGYLYEQVNLDTTSVGDIPDGEELRSAYNKEGVTLGITYTNAYPIFDPYEGFFIAGNMKTNDVIKQGPYSFYKYILEYHKFHLLSYAWVLATKIKAGTIITTPNTEFIPVEERFYGGGSRSIRGYDRQDVGPKDENGQPTGGNSMIEFTLESRFRLIPKYGLGCVMFCDIGSVWEESAYMTMKDLVYAVGAGLRYSTPIGPIGVDIARPIFKNTNNGWQFYFSIGHSF